MADSTRATLVHRMHLKGPWLCEWLAGDSVPDCIGPESSARVKLPAAWSDLFGDVPGCVRLRRRFQQPTNLDSDERVHIAFDGIGGNATVRVNDVELGQVADIGNTVSFDITPCLQRSNELTVELTVTASTPAPAGPYAPVAVEIHRIPERAMVSE